MKIEAYLLTWNESDIVELVIKHYQKFCDKVIILDNFSTDSTRDIAERMGCEVRTFGTLLFDDAENMKAKNECWKGSDADWVIVADCDEVMFWYNLIDIGMTGPSRPIPVNSRILLQKSTATIFKTQGWQIMSDAMPITDLLEITNGYEFNNYSKNIIFNPKAIQEINYNPGAHRCNPVGNVVWSEETLYVLHYKHIGGVQRTIKRYAEYKKRMSKNNIKKGWGIHYQQTPARLREEWNERMAKSKPLI